MKAFALSLTVALLGASRAQAQQPAQPVQTQFTLRPGWLYISRPAQALVLDTVAAPGRQNIPTSYATLDGYRLALQGSGEVFVVGPDNKTQRQHAYGGQDGGWPVQLLAYANGRVLFLATSDGYLTARKLTLVELNLATNSCQELGRGKQIADVRYAPDLNAVYFTHDGQARTWRRPAQ